MLHKFPVQRNTVKPRDAMLYAACVLILSACSGGNNNSPSPTQQNNEQSIRDERIAALETNMGGAVPGSLAQRMAVLNTPGVQIAVVHEGRLDWTKAYGLDNTESDEALTTETPMQVGSISKPTTALGILMLAQDNALSLDAPLNDALRTWQVSNQPPLMAGGVTPRRVLSHTAGLSVPSYFGYTHESALPSLTQVLEGSPPATSDSVQLVVEPGQTWRYSGGAYTSLAVLLEDITGDRFADWIRQQIFEPAGMSHSTFEQPLPTPGAYTSGRVSVFDTAAPPLVYPELPAAGMWSTAEDLGRLVIEIHNSMRGDGSTVFGEAANALVSPQQPSPPLLAFGLSLTPGMGLGMALDSATEPKWFWHPGSNFGYMALVVGDVEAQGYGAAVITNAFPGGGQLAIEIVNAIADIYEWPDWQDYGLFEIPN